MCSSGTRTTLPTPSHRPSGLKSRHSTRYSIPAPGRYNFTGMMGGMLMWGPVIHRIGLEHKTVPVWPPAGIGLECSLRRSDVMPVLYRQVWGRQLWTKVLQFVLVNCAVFAAYRVSFIRLFGGPKALAETPVALWTGLGLDAGLLALALAALAARRHTRPLAGQAVDLWRPAAFAIAVTVMAALLLVALEIEPTKANKDLEIRLVSSLDRMRLGDYVLNQVIGNPLQDLVRLLGLPDSTTPYQLDAQQALEVSRRLLGLPAGDPAYPLLRPVQGQQRLGIRNVVVIMVEGLSAALIDHRVGGEYVMPYVHGLCEEGLCFRRMIQSFSATDGSVFAIVTSLPPPFALSRT